MDAEATNRYDTVEIDGWKVKQARKRVPLTQAQLVSSLEGVSRGYLSIIENQAKSRVSRSVATRLAGALGLGLSDLQNVAPQYQSPLGSSEDEILETLALTLRETADSLRVNAVRLQKLAELLERWMDDRSMT